MSEVKCWAFATGRLVIWKKASRDAAHYIMTQPGYVGTHVVPDGRMLWVFKSENDAKRAKNNAEAQGAQCGKRVGEVYVDAKYLRGK